MKIDFCKEENISDVMLFIDKYWSKNHILSISKELMYYQHYDEINNRYNYIVGYDDNHNIEGILGFIPTNKYSLDTNSSIWLSLWKTIPNSSHQLGLQLLSFLEKSINHNLIGTIGISDEANQIYKFLKYKVGIMKQFYIVNPNIDVCSICSNPIIEIINSDNESKITELDEQTLKTIDIKHSYIPYKNIDYIVKKYVKHPMYHYKLLYIHRLNLLIVAREITINQVSILRIVDCMGSLDNLYATPKFLLNYIIDNNYEYVDLLSYGLDVGLLEQGGFSSVNIDNTKIIIPMYFEPFLKENKIVRFAYKSKLDNIVLFKADADQDRPNIIREI